MRIFRIIILFLLVGGNAVSKADIITTKDGESYKGKIISQDTEKITLEIKIGIIKFRNEEVASIEYEPADPLKDKVKTERPVQPDLDEGRTAIQQDTEESQQDTEKSRTQIIYIQQQQSNEEKKKALQLKNKEQELPRQKEGLKKKEKAQQTKTTEVKKEEKKETPPSIKIKPTIRGLDTDQYKTY